MCGCFDDAAESAVAAVRAAGSASAREAADGGSLVTCALFVLLQAYDKMMRTKECEAVLNELVGGVANCHASIVVLLANLMAAQGKPGRDAAAALIAAYVAGADGASPALARLSKLDSTRTMAKRVAACARMYAFDITYTAEGDAAAAEAWVKALPAGALEATAKAQILKQIAEAVAAEEEEKAAAAEAALARKAEASTSAPTLPARSATGKAPAGAAPAAVASSKGAAAGGDGVGSIASNLKLGTWPLDAHGATIAVAGAAVLAMLLSSRGQSAIRAVQRSIGDLGRIAFGTPAATGQL